jgi:hypothetical protein
MRVYSTQQSEDGGGRAQPEERQPGAAAATRQLVDSPRLAAHRAVADGIQNSPRVAAQREQQQALTGGGLPAQLKAGVEALSGMSIDGVRVHYNSNQPAQLRALAYARGTDIHLGPGQEEHLPHEAWHVVQQAQGRVRPTIQAKGLPVNDEEHLEQEADRMGAQALRIGTEAAPTTAALRTLGAHASAAAALQRAEDESEPADGEQLVMANATRVGVQLVLDDKGGVSSVLVAGRPKSPFTGTMGDHVTAFGVHVINLRKAMVGLSLDDAFDALSALADSALALGGVGYAKETGEQEWFERRKQLEADKKWAPEAPLDYRVAHLQWLAGLYLEVREGIPLSLVNTRSVTALSGRGRGEAEWFKVLRDHEPDDEVKQDTKRTKREEGKSAQQDGEVDVGSEIDIALGLFDDDAAALLTFMHELRDEGEIARLLPGHTDVAEVAGADRDELMTAIARQHVASVFPLLEQEKAELVEEAVVARLKEAHKKRTTGDVKYWFDKLGSVTATLGNAYNNTVDVGWGGAWGSAGRKAAHAALDLAVKLLLFSKVQDTRKGEVRGALEDHILALDDTLDVAVDASAMVYEDDALPLLRAMKDYFKAVGEQTSEIHRAFSSGQRLTQRRHSQGTYTGKLDPDRLPKKLAEALASPLAVLEGRLGVVLKLLDNVDVDSATSDPPTESNQTTTADVSMEPGKTQETQQDEPMEEAKTGRKDLKRKDLDAEPASSTAKKAAKSAVQDFARRPIISHRPKSHPSKPTDAEVLAKEGMDAIMGELSKSVGNSFTVALRLDRDGKIGVVTLRGRPPSPFKGTMGAHSTAWLVWVNAIVQQLTGVTLPVAGQRLGKFANDLVEDARRQTAPITKAQNSSRRAPAQWNSASLDAWEGKLASFVPRNAAWTVNAVQAYAQAILTFANQLPGTTRAGKNTNGHGEAKHWRAIKASYKEGGTDAEQALEGMKLFDAAASSSVRDRHRWLMGLALGETSY